MFGQVFVHFFFQCVQLITNRLSCLYLNEAVKMVILQKYLFKIVAIVVLRPP